MNQSLTPFSVFKSSPHNKLLWITIAIVIKLAIGFILIYNLGFNLHEGKEVWGVNTSGDAADYITSAENIIDYGVYSYSGTNFSPDDKVIMPYTSRMPGYEVVLVPFRYVFSHSVSLQLIVLFQIILSAISVYCLGLIAKIIFKKDALFYITFFIYGFSTYISIYDITILTESLSTSTLIFSMYFLIRNRSKYDYLLSGLFLTWSIFLRQYLAPIYVFYFAYVLFVNSRKIKEIWANRKTISLSLFLLILPFLVFDSIWIIRNYRATQKTIILVDDIHGGAGKMPNKYISVVKFVQCWGGDIIDWNHKAEMTLFWPNPTISNPEYATIESLPEYIYTSHYNVDSLKKIREYIALSLDTSLNGEDIRKLDNLIINKLDTYSKSFKEEKPFYYYVVARLRLIPKFIFHSGTYNISGKSFAQQNLIQKMFKLSYSALYWAVLSIGFIGVFLILVKGSHLQAVLVSSIPLYVVVLCALLLKRIEYRYFFPSYPFLLLIMSYTIYTSISKFNRKSHDLK